MHFEILVEDQSGKKALDMLVPKIIGEKHTYRIISYNGIGHIPSKMPSGAVAKKRTLLDNLQKLLRGYGRSWGDFPFVVFVVCDLDDKCLRVFRKELLDLLENCSPKPETRFCVAIEEGEAWLLGDMPAIKAAYPGAKSAVLSAYKNDAVCGTWEFLADAVCIGGSRKLAARGWQAVGAEKSQWAEKITPHMDVANNASPSFGYFCRKLREIAEA